MGVGDFDERGRISDEALIQLAEQLAGDQAADDQRMAQLDEMDELVRLAMQVGKGMTPLATHSIQTMAVLRAAQRMKMEAVRDFMRTIDAQRRASSEPAE